MPETEAITPEQAIFLSHSFLPSLEREQHITAAILKAIPADKADYRPDPNSMSAFDLAWHIASSQNFFLSSLPAGEFSSTPSDKPKTLEAVIGFYEEGFQQNFAAIKAMTGEQLAKTIDFMGVFQLAAVSYVNFCICHEIHHRGQLSVYLRPMGAAVPAIYGESYDSKQARLAMSGS